MNCKISVIIPNRNGAATIVTCLAAALASRHRSFEVIVVDDCSEDNSVALIRQFPCRLIELTTHHGAAAARNIGAGQAHGQLLFFTDADCVLLEDTLCQVERSCRRHGKQTVVGGTYSCQAYDASFYSTFQAVFVHYSETKNPAHPDYIASHALAMAAESFQASAGFPENFPLPIIEDVAFCHALKRQGLTLTMNPRLQVRHIFQFSFWRSLGNAFNKARHWTIYSLTNNDLLTDSGCASHELKINVLCLFASLALAFLSLWAPQFSPFLVLPLLGNLAVSRRLLSLFLQTGGLGFFSRATLHYLIFYAAAVGCGGAAGFFHYLNPHRRNQPLPGRPLWLPQKN